MSRYAKTNSRIRNQTARISLQSNNNVKQREGNKERKRHIFYGVTAQAFLMIPYATPAAPVKGYLRIALGSRKPLL